MGLYICRVIVEAHNGRVWVDSAGSGQGSSFKIALPLVEP
jgi:signal transduction histidine kinase